MAVIKNTFINVDLAPSSTGVRSASAPPPRSHEPAHSPTAPSPLEDVREGTRKLPISPAEHNRLVKELAIMNSHLLYKPAWGLQINPAGTVVKTAKKRDPTAAELHHFHLTHFLVSDITPNSATGKPGASQFAPPRRKVKARRPVGNDGAASRAPNPTDVADIDRIIREFQNLAGPSTFPPVTRKKKSATTSARRKVQEHRLADQCLKHGLRFLGADHVKYDVDGPFWILKDGNEFLRQAYRGEFASPEATPKATNVALGPRLRASRSRVQRLGCSSAGKLTAGSRGFDAAAPPSRAFKVERRPWPRIVRYRAICAIGTLWPSNVERSTRCQKSTPTSSPREPAVHRRSIGEPSSGGGAPG